MVRRRPYTITVDSGDIVVYIPGKNKLVINRLVDSDSFLYGLQMVRNGVYGGKLPVIKTKVTLGD